MRFWLSAFVVLFAIAELFNWIAQVGSWQASGIWLVLGGMGLAAVSNGGFNAVQQREGEKVESESVEKVTQEQKTKQNKLKPSKAKSLDRSEDSISFKVRPLKR
jgi:hypothetical protein